MSGKMDEGAFAGLIEKLATAKGARKALAIGTPDRHDWLVSLARGLRSDGVLIVFYPDPGGVRTLRRTFERAGVAGRANVIPGDPALLVRKVAGPFDVVLNSVRGDEHAWRDRLMPLIAPGGLLITPREDGIDVDVR